LKRKIRRANTQIPFQEIRVELDNVLEDKISSPERDLLAGPSNVIIKTIVRLISTE
jgi:hypothetical protein